MKNKKYAVGLIVLLSLPALFFLVFMFGEVLGGDIGGLGHLLQASPFLVLIFLVWRWGIRKK